MSNPIDPNHTSHSQRHSRSRDHLAHRRVFRRSVLVWVVVALLLAAAVPTVFYAFAHGAPGASLGTSRLALTSATPTSPSDWFMQSIVTDDGALGWHQLCPSIQAQLPIDTLVQQANEQRTALAKQGVRLTMALEGTHSQQDGGVSHVYVVTAHWPSGATQTRKFTVLAQQSGCVEDVQT